MKYIITAFEVIRSSRSIVIMIWTLLVLFFLIGITQLFVTIYSFIPPYVIPEVKLVNNPVKAGDDLVVTYHIIRKRICRTELDRFMKVSGTQDVVWRDRVPGIIAGDIDERANVQNTIRVPPNLKPGRYIYQVTSYNDCPEGLFPVALPPVEFEVVP